MKRKEIQEARMKEYFIKATKEIIIAEGIKALSVRSIAEKAGYSFATLYNYFRDVKDLIFICVEDFAKECEEYVVQRSKDEKPGKPKLKKIVQSYVEYMVQYPGVFDLFYVEKIEPAGTSASSAEIVVKFIDRLCEKDLEQCVADGTYRAGEALEKVATIRNSVTGILLLYMNRHHPKSYYDFVVNVNRQIERILD